MRKNVLKYDDVMNLQRTVIYEQRRRVLEGDDLSEEVGQWINEIVERAVDTFQTEEAEGLGPRPALRGDALALRLRRRGRRAARGLQRPLRPAGPDRRLLRRCARGVHGEGDANWGRSSYASSSAT